MTAYRESRFVPVPPQVLFDLVADVERYPKFLPLWRSARIISHDGDCYVTEQEVGLGPMRERFRTRTLLHPYDSIDVTSTDPLFRAFHIGWRFQPHRAGARVDISLLWEVQSRLLQGAINAVLPITAERMVEAFAARAVHGAPNAASPSSGT